MKVNIVYDRDELKKAIEISSLIATKYPGAIVKMEAKGSGFLGI